MYFNIRKIKSLLVTLTWIILLTLKENNTLFHTVPWTKIVNSIVNCFVYLQIKSNCDKRVDVAPLNFKVL